MCLTHNRAKTVLIVSDETTIRREHVSPASYDVTQSVIVCMLVGSTNRRSFESSAWCHTFGGVCVRASQTG